MIVAPCGACTVAPTAWIFPCEMTTVPLGIFAPTTGTTVPPRMTYVPVCACATSRELAPAAATATASGEQRIRFSFFLRCYFGTTLLHLVDQLLQRRRRRPVEEDATVDERHVDPSVRREWMRREDGQVRVLADLDRPHALVDAQLL